MRFTLPPRAFSKNPWSWLIGAVVLVLLGHSGVRTFREVQRLVLGPPKTTFCDLPIFLSELETYKKTGQLYDVERPNYSHPGSPVFKYPPAAAVALLPSLNRPKRIFFRAQPLVRSGLAALALSAVLALLALRPGPVRGMLSLLVFLNWAGWRETMGGPQFETYMLLCLVLALVFLRVRRPFWVGVSIGFCGVFKVYTWGLAALDVARRRWRVLAGILIGAAVPLLLSGIFFPLRFTSQYLFQIMPHLGGVSLGCENVGLAGDLARLSYSVLDSLPPSAELDYQSLTFLHASVFLDTTSYAANFPTQYATTRLRNDPPPRGLPGLTMGAYLLVAAVLLGMTWRTVRRSRRYSDPSREFILLAVGTCLLLALTPTSWLNYQLLLILCVFTGLALLPPLRKDPLGWALLALACIGGTLPTDGVVWMKHPVWHSTLRSLVPLALWFVHLRLLGRAGADEGPLRVSGREEALPVRPRGGIRPLAAGR